MTACDSTVTTASPGREGGAIKLAVIFLVSGILIGLLAGDPSDDLPLLIARGFSKPVGDLFLVLGASFMIAEYLSLQGARDLGRLGVFVSPVAGAGMICPDTAYAALSPAAGGRKLPIALGAYAGFKLLPPAGPLIVATALGAATTSLFFFGLIILVPAILAGEIWNWFWQGRYTNKKKPVKSRSDLKHALLWWLPILTFVLLLAAGYIFDLSANRILAFLSQPVGALLSGGVVAYVLMPRDKAGKGLVRAVERTAKLLILIGAASTFGTIIAAVFMPDGWTMDLASSALAVLALFGFSVLIKALQGSSMATFAVVGPLVSPFVQADTLSLTAATFAICLGTFGAILPNDSFYWLVKTDALQGLKDLQATFLLTGGAAVQALTGLVFLLLLVGFNVL